ncbi:MAG: RNA-binding domain-containing protein, partial [Thermoplasmata archaeon]
VEVKEIRSTGFYGNPIIILEGKIEKDKQMKSFWEKLEDVRPGIIKSIVKTLDSRIDNEGTFFVRFDKQRAYLGEYKLAEGQDVIETRWRVAAYPSKREVASKELKLFFEELTKKEKE